MNKMQPDLDRGGVPRRSFLVSALLLNPAARLLWSGQDTTFSTDVKVVNVLATVRDKHGQIIANLNKDDFTLEEDDRPSLHVRERDDSGRTRVVATLNGTLMP